MTETPWMKGPWWVEKRSSAWQVQTAHRGPGSSFCIAALNDWTEGAEATARLMAAAPELYAALKRMEAHFRILPPDMDAPGSVFAQACAALAKATGETP